MKNNKKEEYVKYDRIKQVRLSKQLDNLIEAKALEANCNSSEIIREAIISFLNRNMSDTEIVHSSIAENTRKVRYLEDKVELLGLIVMEQTKYIMKMFPMKQINLNELVDLEFEKFRKDCMKTLKKNHGGMLESMILDLYEQGVEG